MDNEIIKLFKKNKSQHAIIIVLFKGKKLPKFCVPMARNPKPKMNIPLNTNFSNFPEIYFSALKENPSIRDEAILIQSKRETPILRGFSYRLFPPLSKVTRAKNKGSGYNSSLDFSVVKRVMCVYFINKNGVQKFTKGKGETIFKLNA